MIPAPVTTDNNTDNINSVISKINSGVSPKNVITNHALHIIAGQLNTNPAINTLPLLNFVKRRTSGQPAALYPFYLIYADTYEAILNAGTS